METNESSATAVAEPVSPATVAPGTSDPAATPAANTGDGETAAAATGEEGEGTVAPPSPYPVTVPEGMVLNEALMTAVTPILQKMNLNLEQVQELSDAVSQAEAAKEEAKKKEDAQAFLDQAKTWQEEVKTDKELGGQKYTENLAMANQALKQFGSPELITLLTETGLGNHKEVVRAFHNVGKQLLEGAIVPGNPTGGENETLADRLYGGSSKKSTA